MLNPTCGKLFSMYTSASASRSTCTISASSSSLRLEWVVGWEVGRAIGPEQRCWGLGPPVPAPANSFQTAQAAQPASWFTFDLNYKNKARWTGWN